MPPNSAHPPNTSRRMIFSLLKTHYSDSNNKFNCEAQANKLLNDLLERGCNQKKALDMLKEAGLKLMEMSKRRRNQKKCSS